MKNIYLYYIFILAPLLFILWLSSSDTIDSTLFFIVLIVYAFIYRPFVDGKRLAEKKYTTEQRHLENALPWTSPQLF